jgi:small subunit ribosomal protein S20
VANIKSQIKRVRTNEKRRLRNKAAKSEVKTRIKTALREAEAGSEHAQEALRMAVKRLDKAAARGIIHRNQAANRKSRLMRHFEWLSSQLREREGEAGPGEAEAS